MKTAILVHGPDFACSENLTKVFSLWGETRLISIYPSDWRNYDPGLLVHDGETLEEARAVVDDADLIYLGDATAFFTLAKVSPDRRWLRWANRKNVAVFFGDTAYFKRPRFFDGLCIEMGVTRAFFLPNLVPFAGLKAVPLHHPMPVTVSDKAEKLTVMHAPGRNGKAAQKGTAAIEEVVAELQEDMDFDYRRLMYLPLEECLKIKATAHIVIDQLPDEGLPSGLGKTGLEALAASSAVITSMYDRSSVRGFSPMPPVVPVRNKNELKRRLGKLLANEGLRQRLQEQSVKWVREVTEFEPWLRYVERWL